MVDNQAKKWSPTCKGRNQNCVHCPSTEAPKRQQSGQLASAKTQEMCMSRVFRLCLSSGFLIKQVFTNSSASSENWGPNLGAGSQTMWDISSMMLIQYTVPFVPNSMPRSPSLPVFISFVNWKCQVTTHGACVLLF